MASVTFIGLGLNDEKSMSLEGLEQARQSVSVFLELYTSPMTNLDVKRLAALIGKEIVLLTRSQLEDEGGAIILTASKNGKVAFLVPGDPMVATTHVSLRLILAKQKISTRIVHGQSIISAIAGATGLQSYKFGKSITLPSEQGAPLSVMDTITDNTSRGLHTLLLLDPPVLGKNGITISQAIHKILDTDPGMADTIVVGAARVGAHTQEVKAGSMKALEKHDFGSPPHTLVFVGRLHFMEAEALQAFCGATQTDVEDLI